MKKSIMGLITGLFALAIAGCASTGISDLPEETSGSNVPVETYKMDVGDMVTVSVWRNEDLSTSAPVRPDGKIAVPLVGDVTAAGIAPEELADTIEAELANYIKSPNVTVILTALEGSAFLSRVRVTGAVEDNLSMTYHQGMTVLDAVLEAGGVTIYADSNRTKLHRRTDAGAQTYNINLKNILEKGDMTTNVQLKPGDVITVPESAF